LRNIFKINKQNAKHWVSARCITGPEHWQLILKITSFFRRRNSELAKFCFILKQPFNNLCAARVDWGLRWGQINSVSVQNYFYLVQPQIINVVPCKQILTFLPPITGTKLEAGWSGSWLKKPHSAQHAELTVGFLIHRYLQYNKVSLVPLMNTPPLAHSSFRKAAFPPKKKSC